MELSLGAKQLYLNLQTQIEVFNFQKIAQILGGKPIASEQIIHHFAYDSRLHLESPKTTLFVALKTEKGDGHQYIPDLIVQGVSHFIISDSSVIVKGAYFIEVVDTLRALQSLATFYRQHTRATVIGITGSNGKTIAKDALASICEGAGLKTVKSPRSFNSQLGVALSLLQLKSDTEVAIIEAGISKIGEMENLAQMIQPDLGICTHLGDAHDTEFESVEDKIKEKSKLFFTSSKILINANNKFVIQIRKYSSFSRNWEEIEWRYEENYLILRGVTYKLNHSDEVSLNNLALAIRMAEELGISISNIQDSLDQWTLPSNRLKILDGQHNSILINDSYTSDNQALQAAIHFTKRNAGDREWVAIITAFEGEEAGDQIVNMLKEHGAKEVYTIGKGFSPSSFDTASELIQKLSPIDFKDRVVLIKGLRKYKLDKVSHWLEAKKNTTQLIINLDLLKANYEMLKSHVSHEVKKLVMLKAYAYGSGAGQMARFLKTIQPDYVGVAHADEGVELRKAGLNLPILVLYTDIEDIETLIEYKLEPVVYSLSYLEKLCQFKGGQLSLHIEFDTGMHRLGFDPGDMAQMCTILSKSAHRVVGIMSHLSSADDTSLDPFTQSQISLFRELAQKLEFNLGYKAFKHICNSIGTERFPNAHFDMVRLGIGLYGFVSGGTHAIGSLQSRIVQIKSIPAGDGIGYGNLDPSKKDRKIAVIPIGYADGFDRALGNGNWSVLVNKKKCITVGNICMDMCMIDVTDVKCKEGDLAILFGSENTVEEMAKVLQTIPYEIVSRISERVKRVYLSE